MSHWNYRIIQNETGYTIREVYYKDDGSIFLWSEKPCYPYGEDKEDLLGDFMLMEKAFSAPILYEKDGVLQELEGNTTDTKSSSISR